MEGSKMAAKEIRCKAVFVEFDVTVPGEDEEVFKVAVSEEFGRDIKEIIISRHTQPSEDILFRIRLAEPERGKLWRFLAAFCGKQGIEYLTI